METEDLLQVNASLQKAIEDYKQYSVDISQRVLSPNRRHPWDSGDHKCNLWIDLFCDTKYAQHLNEHSNNALELYMRSRVPFGTSQKRLIVLEGMVSDVVELIGADLRIPPAFFLAHCDEWSDLSIVDYTRAKQSAARYWKVPVPQSRTLPENFTGPYGNYLIESGSFNRSSIHITRDSRVMNFRSYVSFWGQDFGDGSWIAVLLTDPPEARIRYQENKEIWYELDNFKPLREVLFEVSVNPSNETQPQGWSMGTPLHNRSCFNTIKSMYGKSNSLRQFSDPFSATLYIRYFIRSVWEEWINRNISRFHDTELEDLKNHRGPRAFEHRGDRNNKALDEYQQLVDSCHHVRLDKKAVRTISWAFRNENRNTQIQTNGTPQAMSDGEKNHNDQCHRDHQATNYGQEEDSRVWSLLEERLDLMEGQIGEWMNMFAQRAAMEEALEANRQARSAGQLTKLATVAVPTSIVAAVFPMGGDFAAGERLFFVFWAITLPVTLALLLWVLHGDIRVWWRKRRHNAKGREMKRAWTIHGWRISLNCAAQPDEEKAV